MRIDIPAYRQERSWSCLAACLRMCFAYHGHAATEDAILRLCQGDAIGLSLQQGVEAAQRLGFTAELRFDNELEWLWERVALEDSVIIPVLLAPSQDRLSRHAVVLCGVDEAKVLVLDPAVGTEVGCPILDFDASWSALDGRR